MKWAKHSGACPLPLSAEQSEARQRAIAFSASAVFHLVLFATAIYTPSWHRGERIPPPAISVTMVSLPGTGNAPRAAKVPAAAPNKKETTQAEAPAQPPKAEAAKAPEPVKTPPKEVKPAPVEKPPAKDAISLDTKKEKPKEEPKPKPAEETSREQLQKALAQLKQKTAAGPPNSVTKAAMDRLRQQVAGQPGRELQAGAEGASGTGIGLRGTGPGLSYGSPDGTIGALTPIGVYLAEVGQAFQENWAFADQLTGAASNLEAKVGFEVLPSGKIKKIWFDQRSGNSFLDNSAYNAVAKSDPLPPFPPEIREPSITWGARFTPKGLQ